MPSHSEERQVFNKNGLPVHGQGIDPELSRKTPEIIVGAAHIWIWRRSGTDLEILLQKRAAHKPTWPGKYDISAAGHIDVGENPLQAAAREAREEIGLELNQEYLDFIFAYRNFSSGIKWVYVYEQSLPVNFQFSDGEVDALEWRSFVEFQEMVRSPDGYNLVPHPPEYFNLLIKSLKIMHENH